MAGHSLSRNRQKAQRMFLGGRFAGISTISYFLFQLFHVVM